MKITVSKSRYPLDQSEGVSDVYGVWDLRKRKVMRLNLCSKNKANKKQAADC